MALTKVTDRVEVKFHPRSSPKIVPLAGDHATEMMDVMTYAYLAKNPQMDLAHYNALGFYIEADDLDQLDSGECPFQMFAPASENAYKIQFQPGYYVFNPLNTDHQILWESFKATNEEFKTFFKQYHFAAQLQYDDHVHLLITLPEIVEIV
jgi:UDP-N-acetylmuramate-alanine ligase